MVTKFTFILFVFFISFKSEAAQTWKYTAFPYVPKNLPAKATEPNALRVSNAVLHPIMSRDSSTHAYWGVEQVYLSRDLKKKVYVKYNVKLNSVNPIGSWIALKGGHILHLNNGLSTVAYYAEGMNNVDLLDIQKQFMKSRKAAAWNVLNPFMSCANAEVTSSGDNKEVVGTSEPQAVESSPSMLKRAGNVIACTGKETFDSAWESAKGLYENASWENIKNGTKATALAAWDAIPSWEETKAGFRATGDFISSTWSDPGKAWDGVKDKFEKTKQVVAQVYEKVAGAVENFKNLDTDVQDRIVCDAVSNLAADGIIGVLLSATGAGAAAAAAKLAHAVYKYAKRIKPLMAAIEVLANTKDMAKDKLMQAVDKILKGKMDPKELEKLQAQAAAKKAKDDAVLTAENDKIKAAAAAEKQAMLDKAGAMSNPERLKAAEEVLGKPLTAQEKAAVIRAHEVAGNKTYAQLTPEDLRAKRQVLKDAGFTDAQANALMRRGITGRGNTDYTVLPDRPGIEDYRLRAEALSAQKSPEALSAMRTAVAKYDTALKDEAAGYKAPMTHSVRKSNASDTAARLVKMETEPERIKSAKEVYGRMQMATLEEQVAGRGGYMDVSRLRGEAYEELVYMMNTRSHFNRNHAEALVEALNNKYRGQRGWVPLDLSPPLRF